MEETKDMRMAEWREALRKAKTAKERTSTPRVKMTELAADYRVTCNEEVNQGLTIEMAMAEASRCLDCANPQCVTGCPVGIDIPGFIKNVERGEFAEAARVIKKASALPAVCVLFLRGSLPAGIPNLRVNPVHEGSGWRKVLCRAIGLYTSGGVTRARPLVTRWSGWV